MFKLLSISFSRMFDDTEKYPFLRMYKNLSHAQIWRLIGELKSDGVIPVAIYKHLHAN